MTRANQVRVSVGRGSSVPSVWASRDGRTAVVRSFHTPPRFVVFTSGAGGWLKHDDFPTLKAAIREARRISGERQSRVQRDKSKTLEIHDIKRFLDSKGRSNTTSHAQRLYVQGYRLHTLETLEPHELSRLLYGAQRDAGLDKKALHKTIDADLKLQAKRKLHALRAELKAAYAADRNLCGAARQKAKHRIQRLRERRDVLRAQIRRLLERERLRKREACSKRRKSETCTTTRKVADARIHRLRARRNRLPLQVRGLVHTARGVRNTTCSTKPKSTAARAALREERNYQQSLKRSATFARQRTKRPGVAKSRERRSESDDAVRHNIPPHLISLWNRVKGGIKGSSRKSRTEEFFEYVEEHPSEEFADSDDATDSLVADLERQMRAGRRDYSSRGATAPHPARYAPRLHKAGVAVRNHPKHSRRHG